MVLAADSYANRKSGGVTRNQGPLWRGTSERLLDPEGGDASAWPPFWLILDYKHTVGKKDTEIMGRLVTQRLRPTRPPGRSGPMDRTAGGIGGAAPASLDLYGQSRFLAVILLNWPHRISM